MKRSVTLLVIMTLLVSFAQAEKLAVVTKTQGDVMLQKSTDLDYVNPVSVGTILEENDQVRVGEDGFAVLLLLDDKSQVKLRPNTEVMVQLSEDLMGTRLTFQVDNGQIRTQYDKDADFEFQIATPTSVASVKGTDWWTLIGPDGDMVIVIEGLVEVMNNLTGMIMTGGAGETVNSGADGLIDTAPTEEGSIPQDPEDEFGAGDEGTAAPSDSTMLDEETDDMAQTATPSATMPDVEGEMAPEEEAEGGEEEGEGLFGGALAMDAGFGAVTIDGTLYNQIALRPDISVGKLGVGLDLVIYMDQDGNIREDEWNFDEPGKDILDKIMYVRWGQPGDPLYIRVGTLENVVFGYGLLMNGYSNMMQYPSIRKMGTHFGMQIGNIGVETMVADFKEVTTDPEFGFGVGALRGTYNLGKIKVGGTLVMDQNQYLGLKDTDNDGYPDLVDGSPENAYVDPRMNVDSDGDGVVDGIDPDRDGDGYTDNSPPGGPINNDPKLTDEATFQSLYLKEDPFNAHDDAHALTGFSVDIGYPLLNMNWLNLLVYSEAGSYFGKIAEYNAVNGNTTLTSIETNFGAVVPGLRAQIIKFITATLEYRIANGNFVYGLWDQNYDLERVAFRNYGGILGLKPVTRYERLYDPAGGSMMGIFGTLGADVMGMVTLSAGYQDMFSGDNPVKGIQGMIALSPDLIPKVEDARAYILRMNVDDPWDFKSEGTLLGYRVTMGLGGGATLTWDFRQSYVDINGDLDVDDEGETITQTSIETGFSF